MAQRDLIAPTLDSFSLPAQISFRYGRPPVTIPITASDAGGAGIDHVELVLDRTFSQNLPSGTTFSNTISFGAAFFSNGSTGGFVDVGNLNTGTYNVVGANVYDRQGNIRTYSSAEVQALGGRTSFEVVSNGAADTTPALLNSLDLPNTVDLTAGAQAPTIFGSTNESLQQVRIHLDRPVSTSTGFTSDFVFGPAYGSSFSQQVFFTQATAAGTYNVTSIDLVDLKGNTSTFTGAQLAAMGTESSFTVVSPTARETVAPVLTALTVSTPDITNLSETAAYLDFTATATDTSGIDRIIVRFDHSVYATDPALGSRNATEVTIRNGTGRLNLVEGTARGDYTITSVEVFDVQGNRSTYSTSQLAVLGAATGFTVIERAVDGTAGDDVLNGSNLVDNISGFAGNDVLNGLDGNDVLSGGDGNDVLNGGAGSDRMSGGAGNDTLDGGTGLDYMTGGLGDDTYLVDNSQDSITELENEGFDTVIASASFQLSDRSSIERMVAANGANPPAINLTGNFLFQEITGNDAANQLSSFGGGDSLFGLGGNDMLTGDQGNNILDGGTGADRMEGGYGNDIYFVDNSGDVVFEALDTGPRPLPGNGGQDVVRASVDFILPTLVEDLVLTGNANRGTGNELANTIYGNDTGNVIFGLAGSDTLFGLGGDDGIIGGDGDDGIGGGAGNDYIDGGAGNDYLLGDAGSDTILGGDGNDNIFGGDGDDGVQGGNGSDRIEGGAGADFIFGQDGDDTILGDAGNDNLYGGAGNDSILGGSGDDAIYGEAGSNFLTGGTGNDRLFGGDGSDTINGDEGNDRLSGGAGDDGLRGGDGDDFLEGGEGADWLLGDAGSDTIRGDGGNDNIVAGAGDDGVLGGAGDDRLGGNEGSDYLYGEAGNDVIAGGAGVDFLNGGAGNDAFVFDAALGTSNADLVMDFTQGQDAILLDRSVFTGLGLGALSADAFAIGAAGDANDRIVYDPSNGALSFDPDGNGTAAAITFAWLQPNTPLGAGDFVVI